MKQQQGGLLPTRKLYSFLPSPCPVSWPCQPALAGGRSHAQLLAPCPPAWLWSPSSQDIIQPPAADLSPPGTLYAKFLLAPHCRVTSDARETPLAAEVVPCCPRAELALLLSLACSLFLEVSRKPSFSHICEQAIAQRSGAWIPSK